MRVGNESAYLQLLQQVRMHGERRQNRTGKDTISLYGPQLRINLEAGFPLFTTKKVWWKGIAVELDWMLQGTGNIQYLKDHGVGIWDAWAKADYRPEMGYDAGELGPVYGVQWRRWPAPEPIDTPPGDLRDDFSALMEVNPKMAANLWWKLRSRQTKHVDQIAQVVAQLRRRASGEVHSDDRRILLSAWNVAEIDRMKLPPCHYACQFLVDNDLGLTTIVSMRSWDLFLGGPFNIAQYALLSHLLSHVCGLVPRTLIFNAGDAHIYVNHLDQVDEQLSRMPTDPPFVLIDGAIKEIDDFRWDRVTIMNYNPQAPIKGEVAV